jgi:hypothetical protein
MSVFQAWQRGLHTLIHVATLVSKHWFHDARCNVWRHVVAIYVAAAAHRRRDTLMHVTCNWNMSQRVRDYCSTCLTSRQSVAVMSKSTNYPFLTYQPKAQIICANARWTGKHLVPLLQFDSSVSRIFTSIKVRLGCDGFAFVEIGWVRLAWLVWGRLGQVILGWLRLGEVRLGLVELGWVGLVCEKEMSTSDWLPRKDQPKISAKESLTAMLPFTGKIFMNSFSFLYFWRVLFWVVVRRLIRNLCLWHAAVCGQLLRWIKSVTIIFGRSFLTFTVYILIFGIRNLKCVQINMLETAPILTCCEV